MTCKIVVRGLMPVPSIPSGPPSYRPFDQIEIECPESRALTAFGLCWRSADFSRNVQTDKMANET